MARGKGKKHAIINLDIDPNEAGSKNGAAFSHLFVAGEEGLSDDICKKFRLLSKKLSGCAGCPHGTDAYCIKHPNGAHV